MKVQIKGLLFFSIISLIILETFNNIGLGNSFFKLLKYIITFAVFSICTIKVMNNLKVNRKLDYIYELKRISIVLIVFLIISIFKVYKTKCFTSKTFEELMQIAIPVLYTFFIINFMKLKDIIKVMKYALVISLIAYIFTIGIGKFTISNFLAISFSDSYSPFESAPFAEIASSLSAFFIYYRKKYKKSALVAFIFCFLVFKRMLLLQAIILLIVSFLEISDKNVNKVIVFCSKIFFLASTFIFFFFLQEKNSLLFENIFGKNIGDFTMGRVYRLWYPLRNFTSYGFGSTTDVLGYNLELDLVKILIELGIIALVIFVYCYFDLCRNNFYSFIIIVCMFANLLFASCLTSTVGWIFRMICIATIYYKRKEWNELLKTKAYKFVLK